MNALFIGTYRQDDGWGLASKDYLKAIGTKINNITSRPLYLGRPSDINDQSISQYENNLYENYDVVFQHALPHCISINKKIKKNVGLFHLETNNISHSDSMYILNKLDEICVASEQEAKCLKQSGLVVPIKVVSIPLDVEMIENNRSHKLMKLNNVLSNTFKFYTIGEFNERKNILDLVLAFHLAFDIADNVSLVIKSSVPGLDTNQSRKHIEKEINLLKSRLKIRKHYKQELVITDRLTDIDLIGLHNSCDCFISSSLGESFCRPAAEALILGKTPIVTDNTGMRDFINNENGYIVNSKKHPVIVNNRPLSDQFDIYTANEYWYKPNIYSLIDQMKKVYETYKKDRKAYQKKAEKGRSSAQQFSYETIGNKICD